MKRIITKNKKQNKGITLIALVITIIILLILAGITLSALTGDNGLFARAKESKIKAEIAKIKEQIQIDIFDKQSENQGDISEDSLKEILEKYGKLSEGENLADKILTTDRGNYEIKVSEILNGTTKDDEKDDGKDEPTQQGTIKINISPNNTITTEVKIDINYGESGIKQYKIGETNTTWSTYENTITLTSDTVISKGWGNSDKTITVYAKGTDAEGNEQIVTQKIQTLDIDAPAAPVIASNFGYPILTESGFQFDGATTIKYDTRNDITNLYSIDNGTTWQKYTGSITVSSKKTIIAKSVKTTGLETITTKTIDIPSDAINQNGYDGDENTYHQIDSPKYIKVDSSVWGKTVRIKVLSGWPGNQTIRFLDGNDTELSSHLCQGGGRAVEYDKTYNIPENTTKILFDLTGGYFNIYIISLTN